MGINIKTDNLVYPYFVREGANKKEPIKSFPGVFRFSLDRLMVDVDGLKKLGIAKVLLFGIPREKDAQGTSAYTADNVVSSAVRKIKSEIPGITVFTDVCLCGYTDHGHCGIVERSKVKSQKSFIDNSATLRILQKIALAHAEAGADWVAPSAMAKAQVSAIRNALDKNGFCKTKVLGYSAKFASNFYGPFRRAADSSPKFGDRSGYQLDYSNAGIALKEIETDIREGADAVMVKPALSYLDIISQAKNKFNKPLFAFNVSGEYSFVKYGARAGLWDEKKMVFEVVSSIKRAGADCIISYHARDIAKWLR